MVIQKITGLFKKEHIGLADHRVDIELKIHRQIMIDKFKEFKVPEHMYLEWLDKNDSNSMLSLGLQFPFYLQKYDSEELEVEVIAIRFNYAFYKKHADELVLWEYRKFGYPEGKLHAVEGKRKYLTLKQLVEYINNDEFRWVKQMSPPISIGFSLAAEGKFESTYEELKGDM